MAQFSPERPFFAVQQEEWEDLQATPTQQNIQTLDNRRNKILAFLKQSEVGICAQNEDDDDDDGDFEGVPFSASAFSSPTPSPGRNSQHYSIAESLGDDNISHDRNDNKDGLPSVEARQFTFPYSGNSNVSESFDAQLENEGEEDYQSSHGFFAAWGHDEHSNIPFGYDDEELHVDGGDNYTCEGEEKQYEIVEEQSSASRHHTSRTEALYLHHSAIADSRRLKLEEQDSDLTFQPQLSTTSKSAQKAHEANAGHAFDRLIEDAKRKSDAQAQAVFDSLREKARLKEEAEAKELEMAGGGRWNEVGRKADMNRIDSLYYMGVQRYRKQCTDAMHEKQQPWSKKSNSSDKNKHDVHDDDESDGSDQGYEKRYVGHEYGGYEEDADEEGPQLTHIEDEEDVSRSNASAYPPPSSAYHKSSLHFSKASKNHSRRTSGAGDAYGVETSPSKQFKAKPLPKAIYGHSASSEDRNSEEKSPRFEKLFLDAQRRAEKLRRADEEAASSIPFQPTLMAKNPYDENLEQFQHDTSNQYQEFSSYQCGSFQGSDGHMSAYDRYVQPPPGVVKEGGGMKRQSIIEKTAAQVRKKKEVFFNGGNEGGMDEFNDFHTGGGKGGSGLVLMSQTTKVGRRLAAEAEQQRLMNKDHLLGHRGTSSHKQFHRDYFDDWFNHSRRKCEEGRGGGLFGQENSFQSEEGYDVEAAGEGDEEEDQENNINGVNNGGIEEGNEEDSGEVLSFKPNITKKGMQSSGLTKAAANFVDPIYAKKFAFPANFSSAASTASSSSSSGSSSCTGSSSSSSTTSSSGSSSSSSSSSSTSTTSSAPSSATSNIMEQTKDSQEYFSYHQKVPGEEECFEEEGIHVEDGKDNGSNSHHQGEDRPTVQESRSQQPTRRRNSQGNGEGGDIPARYERLYSSHAAKAYKLQQKKEQLEELEKQACTFSPKLATGGMNPIKLATSSKRGTTERKSVNASRKNKAKVREDNDEKESEFMPSPVHDKLASIIARRRNSKLGESSTDEVIETESQSNIQDQEDDEGVVGDLPDDEIDRANVSARITPPGSDDEMGQISEEDGSDEEDDEDDFMSRLARDNRLREERAAARAAEASRRFSFTPDIKVGSSKKSLKKAINPSKTVYSANGVLRSTHRSSLPTATGPVRREELRKEMSEINKAGSKKRNMEENEYDSSDQEDEEEEGKGCADNDHENDDNGRDNSSDNTSNFELNNDHVDLEGHFQVPWKRKDDQVSSTAWRFKQQAKKKNSMKTMNSSKLHSNEAMLVGDGESSAVNKKAKGGDFESVQQSSVVGEVEEDNKQKLKDDETPTVEKNQKDIEEEEEEEKENGAGMKSKKVEATVFDRLYHHADVIEAARDSKRKEKEEHLVDGCTFKPSLATSKLSSAQKSATVTTASSSSCHENDPPNSTSTPNKLFVTSPPAYSSSRAEKAAAKHIARVNHLAASSHPSASHKASSPASAAPLSNPSPSKTENTSSHYSKKLEFVPTMKHSANNVLQVLPNTTVRPATEEDVKNLSVASSKKTTSNSADASTANGAVATGVAGASVEKGSSSSSANCDKAVSRAFKDVFHPQDTITMKSVLLPRSNTVLTYRCRAKASTNPDTGKGDDDNAKLSDSLLKEEKGEEQEEDQEEKGEDETIQAGHDDSETVLGQKKHEMAKSFPLFGSRDWSQTSTNEDMSNKLNTCTLGDTRSLNESASPVFNQDKSRSVLNSEVREESGQNSPFKNMMKKDQEMLRCIQSINENMKRGDENMSKNHEVIKLITNNPSTAFPTARRYFSLVKNKPDCSLSCVESQVLEAIHCYSNAIRLIISCFASSLSKKQKDEENEDVSKKAFNNLKSDLLLKRAQAYEVVFVLFYLSGKIKMPLATSSSSSADLKTGYTTNDRQVEAIESQSQLEEGCLELAVRDIEDLIKIDDTCDAYLCHARLLCHRALISNQQDSVTSSETSLSHLERALSSATIAHEKAITTSERDAAVILISSVKAEITLSQQMSQELYEEAEKSQSVRPRYTLRSVLPTTNNFSHSNFSSSGSDASNSINLNEVRKGTASSHSTKWRYSSVGVSGPNVYNDQSYNAYLQYKDGKLISSSMMGKESDFISCFNNDNINNSPKRKRHSRNHDTDNVTSQTIAASKTANSSLFDFSYQQHPQRPDGGFMSSAQQTVAQAIKLNEKTPEILNKEENIKEGFAVEASDGECSEYEEASSLSEELMTDELKLMQCEYEASMKAMKREHEAEIRRLQSITQHLLNPDIEITPYSTPTPTPQATPLRKEASPTLHETSRTEANVGNNMKSNMKSETISTADDKHIDCSSSSVSTTATKMLRTATKSITSPIQHVKTNPSKEEDVDDDMSDQSEHVEYLSNLMKDTRIHRNDFEANGNVFNHLVDEDDTSTKSSGSSSIDFNLFKQNQNLSRKDEKQVLEVLSAFSDIVSNWPDPLLLFKCYDNSEQTTDASINKNLLSSNCKRRKGHLCQEDFVEVLIDLLGPRYKTDDHILKKCAMLASDEYGQVSYINFLNIANSNY